MTTIPNEGSRIRVISKSNPHQYQLGGVYRVCQVDEDGTFRAASEGGWVGDFLQPEDCEIFGIGWDWLRHQLDAHALDLLSAFEGLDSLTLRSDVEAALIASIPDLEKAVFGVLPRVDEELAALQNTPEFAPDSLLEENFN
jgi:hypothetical protein